ncbi:MAG: hypothetical protein ACR2J6_08060 [Thermoleophilaceae bacterium]
MTAPDDKPEDLDRGIHYGSDEYRGLLGQAASEPPDRPAGEEPVKTGRKSGAVGFWLFSFRYAVPAILVLFGAVYAIVDWPEGAEAFSLFAGAGLSILLLNVLFRMGVQGDFDRDREEAARAYFTEHGVWPDEDQAESRPK